MWRLMVLSRVLTLNINLPSLYAYSEALQSFRLWKLWRGLGQSQRKWGFREFESSKIRKVWRMKVNWKTTLFPRIYMRKTKRLEDPGPLDLMGNDPTVQIGDPRHHKWWPTSEWAFTPWPKGHLGYGWDSPRQLRAHPVHRALSSRCVREQRVARGVPSPR